MESYNPKMPLVFFKVGWKEHLQSVQEGKIRFKPLSYYRKKESKRKAYFDSDEGLFSISQPGKAKLFMTPSSGPAKGMELEIKLAGPLKMSTGINSSILCLSYILPGDLPIEKNEVPYNFPMPEGFKEFGDRILGIYNLDEFDRRIKTACQKAGLEFDSGLVTYIDESSHDGHIPKSAVGFVKFKEFEFQREFRYMIKFSDTPTDEFFLEIGSIKDLTFLTPMTEPLQFITRTIPEA